MFFKRYNIKKVRRITANQMLYIKTFIVKKGTER